jgi:hypothetical protein
MPLVGKRREWSHLLVVMAFLYLNRVQKEGLRYFYIMNPSVKVETSIISPLLRPLPVAFLHFPFLTMSLSPTCMAKVRNTIPLTHRSNTHTEPG